MSDFAARLREERKRLGLSQGELAAAGGVQLNAQSNYETGKRSPDAEYLEAIAMHGVDVAYVLTGHRMLMPPGSVVVEHAAPVATDHYRPKPRAAAHVADKARSVGKGTVQREVTPEEAALLDNYKAADEQGRAAARSVLDALAKQKAA
ncbi:hypothetical protein DBA29_22425 [Xenophilus aerolatus]|nr:hypothetical protein [Xenophilus aerolatus]